MQWNLPKQFVLGMLALIAILVGNQGLAGSLSDLESAAINTNPDIQRAALQPLPKLMPPSSKDQILYPKLFGSVEKVSANLSIFPKWTSVLSRYESQRQSLEKDCIRLKDDKCPATVAAWLRFIQGQQGKTVIEKLESVNNYMNMVPYIPDAKVWKINDFWETPIEFLEKNSGDCEDYAIAKFVSLRMLGVPNNAMRIVIVNDQNIRAIHAVLVVYIQGKAYILDNQIKQIVAADSIHHYQPIYSVNVNEWWRHRVS